MDRLHPLTLVVAVAGLAACDAPAPTANTPTKSRVNAVQVKSGPKAELPADFCDTYHGPDDEALFTAPLTVADDFRVPKHGWVWVNVWATWCKPCVEEMPRLVEWEKELKPKGLGAVLFVSADDTAEAVEEFEKAHPDAPKSSRMADSGALPKWLKTLGYEGPAGLPIHVFLDDSNSVRCIRAGGVTENDRASVEALLGT